MHTNQSCRIALASVVLAVFFVAERGSALEDRQKEYLKALPEADQELIRILGKAGARVKLVTTQTSKGAVDDEIPNRVQVIVGSKWTGGEKELDRLRKISTLDSVYFVGKGRITDEALTKLRESLPDVVIKRAARYFLGIMGEPDPKGLRIVRVAPESAAMKAGLHSGDLLQFVAGKPVKTQEDLKEILIEPEPERTVELKLERKGAAVSMTVELEESQ